MYLQHKPALKSKGQLADDKGGILSQSGQLLPQIGDLFADGYDRNDRFHDPVGFLAGLNFVGGDVDTVQADRSGFDFAFSLFQRGDLCERSLISPKEHCQKFFVGQACHPFLLPLFTGQL